MFSSLKNFSSALRPRAKSLSDSTNTEKSIFCRPSRTPLGSPKQKHHKKRNVESVKIKQLFQLIHFFFENAHDLLNLNINYSKTSVQINNIILFIGSSELEPCSSIASLRPGSVALISEQLVPGDRIYSVNGINTSRMRAEDVTKLLENVEGNAMLEIQYSLPNFGKL